MTRALLLIAGAVWCVALGAQPASAASTRHIEPLGGLSTPLGALPLPAWKFGKPSPATLSRDAPPGTFWGGAFTADSGDTVMVYSSSSYPEDDEDRARLQDIADFIGGLPHGPEIALLDVYILTTDEMNLECGADALSCYGPESDTRGMMVLPGEWPDGIPGTEAATHEYGHHIAANRDNDPWAASTWGPKHWGTAMHVCQRFAAGTASPGDEGAGYPFNPGEAWAEAYRIWVWGAQAQLPLAVDESFAPTSAALRAIPEDVSGWTGPTERRLSGHFGLPHSSALRSKRARAHVVLSRTLVVATPLDGAMHAEILGPRGATIALVDGTSGAVLRTEHPTVGMTVCGQRSLRIVLRARAAGAFNVSVSRP